MPFIPRIVQVDPMANLIDEMGTLQAEIRDRETKLKNLKTQLAEHMRAAQVAQYSGKLFAATWVSKRMPRTDWKALTSALDIPRDLIAEYTTSKVVEHPMVTARKGVK